MSAISQMQSASQITGRMVRQAIQEAKADPSQMDQLQQVCDTCHDKFADVRGFDQLVNFVQQYYHDCFEFQDNTANPAAAAPRIDEARITKLRVTETTVDRTPPANPPRGRYRDPLNITGHAEAGAKVEFYNASQPNRPVIGDVKADADGRFRFELTDETKFEYGDQIGVRVLDGSGEASKPVVVPTEPFRMDVTRITYTRGGQVQGSEERTRLNALQPKTDERNPFFQNDKVEPKFTPPKNAGDPYLLELVGGDDAVEPNSTLTVRLGTEVYTTKADDQGQFGLKVYGFHPGQKIKVEVKDINDKGIDVEYRAPDVSLNIKGLTGGVLKPPSDTKPRNANEAVGDGPPWIHIKAANVTVPNGAVILRNTSTGDLLELQADKEGKVNAAVGGVDNFDVLEIATRDANGNVSEDAHLAVMLPEKIGRGMGFLVSADKLNRKQPDVSSVINAIEGPPRDLFIHGQRDRRGPYLKMPDMQGLPPFGQLAVMREGKPIQYMRADQNGALQGLLRGVNVGDQLNFQVLDAAGRKFPMELHGWCVPGAGETNQVPKTCVHSDDRTVGGCLEEIGKGSLDLNVDWLKPFEINTGASQSPETSVPLHYKREFFGPRTEEGNRSEANFDYFPPALQKMFDLPEMTSGKLSLSDNTGTNCIKLDFINARNQTISHQVGVDYVMGQVNLGSHNSPVQIPGSLPQLTQALKGALAFTAVAYEQGKEPGDMEYDRSLGAVKTMLYVFDRLAVDNPEHKDEIIAAAKEAMPDGFAFEVIDRFKVPPPGVEDAQAPTNTARSSAISLIDARTALMGKISGVGQVGQGDADSHPAPRVESATVLAARTSNNGRVRYNYHSTPLHLRGRATPGDIVQVYNVSTGNKTLLGEAVVGSDGTYKLVGGGSHVKFGDQLGVMSVTTDGKKSPMMVVPTDAYSYTSRLTNARPMRIDERPPYFRISSAKLENTTFDADGKVRDGGPYWRLTGDELCVEPFSTVTIRTKTPDGQDHKKEVEVDAEGRFDVEFPHAPRSRFTVQVHDRNNNKHSVAMTTPGLAASVQTGDDAADAASGVVTFEMPNGDGIRGIVTAHSIGDADREMFKISEQDRSDEFVDVVLLQDFAYTGDDGRQTTNRHKFKVKIAKDDAARFSAHVNTKVAVDMPGFASVPMGGDDGREMTPHGQATILDRDFGGL